MPAEFNTLVSLSLTGFKVVQYFVFKGNVTIFYFPISNFLFFNVKGPGFKCLRSSTLRFRSV
jgi:hypothetical protein